jgi:diaminopimelate decarboxylase
MTELIRPALYGSRHTISALGAPDPAGASDVVVHGGVCESTDAFGIHRLPELRRGDLVVIHEAGAYAASFSSRYNGRPPAPEVLLRPDGTLQLSERIAPPARDTKVELT